MAHLFFSSALPRASERSFLSCFVRLGESHVRHELQHVADMGAALFFLVSSHCCMLPLHDLSLLQRLVDFFQLRHFLGGCKKTIGASGIAY